MNKTIKQLLVSLMLVSGTCMGAISTTDTNRSFMSMQSSRDGATHKAYMPVLAHAKKNCGDDKMDKKGKKADCDDENIGLSLMFTGFYNRTKDGGMAKYLGVNGSGAVTFAGTANTDITTNNSVSVNSIFRAATTGTSAGATIDRTLTLNPRSTSFGGHLDAVVDLNSMVEGLSFWAGTAVVRRSNELNAAFAGDVTDATAGVTLASYLSGTKQAGSAALNYAKIDTNKRTKTGLANVDLQLAYKLVEKEKYSMAAYIEVMLPTGNKSEAKDLFEALVGDRNWRVGGGVNFDCSCFENDNGDGKASFRGDVKAQYGMKADQLRTLDVAGVAWAKHLQTVTGSTTQVLAANLVPAATALTQNVKVDPRWMVKALASFMYQYKEMAYEAGYQLFAKQEENNTLVTPWTNGSVYLLQPGALTTQTPAANAASFKEIKDTDLVMNVDSQVWHTFFATIGYVKTDAEYPWSVALGGDYNFSNNAARAPRSWDVYGKVGVNF